MFASYVIERKTRRGQCPYYRGRQRHLYQASGIIHIRCATALGCSIVPPRSFSVVEKRVILCSSARLFLCSCAIRQATPGRRTSALMMEMEMEMLMMLFDQSAIGIITCHLSTSHNTNTQTRKCRQPTRVARSHPRVNVCLPPRLLGLSYPFRPSRTRKHRLKPDQCTVEVGLWIEQVTPCPSFYPSIRLSIRLSIHPSIRPLGCPSISTSTACECRPPPSRLR
jgi:hypothetical protein